MTPEKREYLRLYRKTAKGYLTYIYRNMKRRVEGKQHGLVGTAYLGLALLPREYFYAWSSGNWQFNKLFAAWTSSGYERALTPSIDRIDPAEGYELWNMQWLTLSHNSSKRSEDARAAA